MPIGNPSTPPGQVSSREKIEAKILLIAGKVERGRKAAERREITLYNWSCLSPKLRNYLNPVIYGQH